MAAFTAGQPLTAALLNAVVVEASVEDASSSKIASGVTIDTLALTLAADRTLIVGWIGRVGFDTSAQTCAVDLSVDVGSLTATNNGRTVYAGAAAFAAFSNFAVITGASAGSVTVTATSNASGSAYYQGGFLCLQTYDT